MAARLVRLNAYALLLTTSIATAQTPPDFSGTWTFGSLTPLARPEALADKSHFTEEEALEFETNFDTYIRKIFKEEAGDDFVGDDMWLDFGSYVEPDLRTSRIIDPPDGRFPEATEKGQALMQKFRAARESYAGPEVLGQNERCIMANIPYLRAPDNNMLTIVQTDDHLLLNREFAYGYRIIDLKNKVFPPADMKFWRGASVSQWQDDTLIVETRNMHPEFGIGPTGPDLVLHESFQLTTEDYLKYELTVTSPEYQKSAWTMRTYMRRSVHKNYEYACHEGNFRNMQGILAGQRLLDAEAAAAD